MQKNSNNFIQVSKEFLNEQAKLSKNVSKKAGPYNKHDRKKRRDEVYSLHFDLGYSAVKISEMMKINRNTINSDIKYWYKSLSKEWEENNSDSWIIKQVNRFENQRTRLMKYLRLESEIKNKLKIEKMIFDIDYQIAQIVIKFRVSLADIDVTICEKFNELCKKYRIPESIIYGENILQAKHSTIEKIWKLIREDKKQL